MARKYKRISKDDQIAIAQRQEEAALQQALAHSLDVATMDAVPRGKRGAAHDDQRKQFADQQAEQERRAKAFASRANALRGKPLSKGEREELQAARSTAQRNWLLELATSWEATRARHEGSLEAGVERDEEGVAHADHIAIFDARLDVIDKVIDELNSDT